MKIAGMSDGELKAIWEPFLKLTLDPDEDGWRLGWCPRHSPQHRGLCDAEINFIKRRFRCNAELSCMGGRQNMSLREPTAWILGFNSYEDMMEKRKPEIRVERRQSAAKRRWRDADAAIAELGKAFPRVEPAFLPMRFAAVFIPYLVGEKPIRFNGNEGWWPGWCPLHDQKHSKTAPTAYFNFRMSAYVCLAATPCHAPKRGMSLNNLKSRLGEGEVA